MIIQFSQFDATEKMNALRETYLPQDKSFDLLEFAAFLVLGSVG